MKDEPAETFVPDAYGLRRHPRYRIPLIARVKAGSAESNLVSDEGWANVPSALIHDISLTGFYFSAALPSAQNSLLDVQIVFSAQEYFLKALVQRCEPQPEKPNSPESYGIAALFVRGGDVHAFLSDLASYLNRNSRPRLGGERE